MRRIYIIWLGGVLGVIRVKLSEKGGNRVKLGENLG